MRKKEKKVRIHPQKLPHIKIKIYKATSSVICCKKQKTIRLFHSAISTINRNCNNTISSIYYTEIFSTYRKRFLVILKLQISVNFSDEKKNIITFSNVKKNNSYFDIFELLILVIRNITQRGLYSNKKVSTYTPSTFFINIDAIKYYLHIIIIRKNILSIL